MKPKLVIVLLFVIFRSYGQERSFPVSIAIGDEMTAIPYTVFWNGPYHPVIQVGSEYAYKNSTHHYLYQAANLGYIYHKYLYQGIYLDTELGYDYRFDFGLNLKTLIGIGYLHAFAVQDEYQFENGEYTLEDDWGDDRLMPSLSLGVGYRLPGGSLNSPEIFFLYRSWAEYPYSPGFIPLMTHVDLLLGVKFYIAHSKSGRHEN